MALKHRGDAFWVVYALQIGDDIWVVHAFVSGVLPLLSTAVRRAA